MTNQLVSPLVGKKLLLVASAFCLLVQPQVFAQSTNLGIDPSHDHRQIAQNIIDAASEKIGVTDSEITIGSCISLTGLLQERGKQIMIGANCYFNYINEKGGVNGRKVKLTSCDDGYDPEKAIECFNSCLKNKVFAGAFFAGSAPISKYVRMGETTKTPLMGFCTGTPAVYDFHPTEFVVRASYSDEVNALIDELFNNRRIKKLAIIYQNDAFGAAIRETMVKALAKYGAQPIGEASYSRKTTNVDEAFNQIKGANPDVVMLGATSDALLNILKKRHQQNWAPLLVTVSVATDYILEVPKESEGLLISQVVPPLDEKSANAALYNKLRKKYYPDSAANLSAFEAFENAIVMVEGLKRAGKDLTRDKFIKAMESLRDFDIGGGANFKVNYGPSDHNGLTSKSVYFAIVHGGKLAPLTKAEWKQITSKVK
jgi:branched-chain amino acid transport system substrate-binding protein